MESPSQRIVIVDLRIPFFRLVFFFVKVTLAMLPAAIIVSLIAFLLSALLYGTASGIPELLERWKF